MRRSELRVPWILPMIETGVESARQYLPLLIKFGRQVQHWPLVFGCGWQVESGWHAWQVSWWS